MSANRPYPFEKINDRQPQSLERPGFDVDLRRCIGCHACSVACKTAHDIPLGEFPLRVRWLPRPGGETYAFVPVFSESLCKNDPESTDAGLDPACVRACPTDALRLVDFANPPANDGPGSEGGAQDGPNGRSALRAATAPDLKQDVLYRGLEDWMSDKINLGAALDPRDEDPIYEQD